MRLQRVMPAFAAAIALAGGASPAYAFDNRAPEPGPTGLVSHPAAVNHSGSSGSLVDLGVGVVAGAAIGSLGLAALTRRPAATKGRAGGVVTGRS